MENTSTDQKITPVMDIRQSEKWSQYLAWIGWTSQHTAGDVSVEIMKTGIGGLVKVQRPKLLTNEDLFQIEDISKKAKAIFVKVEPGIGQDMDIFKKRGYRNSPSPLAPPSTIYIDFANSWDTLWNNISKSGRYSIRRSEKWGEKVEFYQNPSSEILHKFYEIEKESAKSQKFMIQSYEDLAKKAEVFGNDSFVALGFDAKGNPTGGKFFLGCENCIWYVHAGTTALGRKSDSGHKTMWESMLHFKKLGYKMMDMDGINDSRFPNFTKNWGGFSFFKEKFGGEKIRFPKPQIKYLSVVLKVLSRIQKLPL